MARGGTREKIQGAEFAVGPLSSAGEERNSEPVVEVDSVTKDFVRRGREPLRALDRVSLSLERGEFLCLLGPSGCGKSTLLSIVAGLTRPSQGYVRFKGEIVTGADPRRGMLFQSPALFPWATILDNVLFGPRAQKKADSATREGAQVLLELVGLRNFEGAYPSELSGGMRHRAAFARALINHPTVLLLDEPFAALDAITRSSMQELLLDLWSQYKMSIMFVTHDVAEAALLGDRIVMMSPRPGRIHSIERNTVSAERRRDVDSLEMANLRRGLRGELAGLMKAGTVT